MLIVFTVPVIPRKRRSSGRAESTTTYLSVYSRFSFSICSNMLPHLPGRKPPWAIVAADVHKSRRATMLVGVDTRWKYRSWLYFSNQGTARSCQSNSVARDAGNYCGPRMKAPGKRRAVQDAARLWPSRPLRVSRRKARATRRAGNRRLVACDRPRIRSTMAPKRHPAVRLTGRRLMGRVVMKRAVRMDAVRGWRTHTPRLRSPREPRRRRKVNRSVTPC